MQVKTRLFIICCCLASFAFGFGVSRVIERINRQPQNETSQSEIAEVESVIDEPIKLPHGGASTILNSIEIEEVGIVEEEIIEKVIEELDTYYYDIINSLSDEDIDLICRIAVLEAGNQCEDGRRAVIEVILNRLMSEYYPNTIYGVLSAEGQFTTWGARNVVSQESIDNMKVILYIVRDTPESAFEKYMEEQGVGCNPHDYVYFARGRFEWANNHLQIEDHWFETR